MGKNFIRTWILCGLLLAGTLQISGNFRTSGEGYLVAVGPAPLRYVSRSAMEPSNLPPLPLERDGPVEATNAPAPASDFSMLGHRQDSGIPGRFFLSPGLWLGRFAGERSVDTGGQTATSPAITASVGSAGESRPAASDLLNIPSAMLVDYLEPAHGSTNAVQARALVPVEFTPPTQVRTESRAVYKTQ